MRPVALPFCFWAGPFQGSGGDLGEGAGGHVCARVNRGVLPTLCPCRLPSAAPVLTHGRADAIALGVDEAPDLREVAVPLGDVLDGGRFHEQCVVGRQRPLDALLVVFHQRGRFAAHEGPHLLEGGDLGFLGQGEAVGVMYTQLLGTQGPGTAHP